MSNNENYNDDKTQKQSHDFPFKKIIKNIKKESSETKDEDSELKNLYYLLMGKINEISNEKEKSSAFINIITKLLKSNITDKYDIYNNIMTDASEIKDDFYRCNIVKDTAQVLTKIDDIDKISAFEKLMDFASGIYVDEDRSEAFISIVRNLLNSDIKDKKIDMINKIILYMDNIRASNVKSSAFGMICLEVASIKVEKSEKLPLLKNIIRIVNNLDDKTKPPAFSKIIKSLVENDINDPTLFDIVIKSLKSISSNKIKADILKKIIEELTPEEKATEDSINRHEFYYNIVETVKDIYSDKSKSELFSMISKKIVLLSDNNPIKKEDIYKSIINNTMDIVSEYHRANTLEDIAESLAKCGFFETAIEIVGVIEDDNHKSLAVKKISREL